MRRIGIMVIVWGAVVVVASAMTWRVIDTAGRQILAEPASPATRSNDGEIGDPASTTRPGPTSTPTAKPTRKPTEKPSSTGTSGATSSPTGKATTSPPKVFTVTRAWKGAAGSMEVSCTGTSVRLLATSPNDGYRAEVEGGSQSSVSVHFEPKTDSGTEVKVIARCVSGSPQFQVEYDDD